MENAFAGSLVKVATAFKSLWRRSCDLWCLRLEVVEKATQPTVRQIKVRIWDSQEGQDYGMDQGSLVPEKESLTSFSELVSLK